MSRHYRPDSPIREARVESMDSRIALVAEAFRTFGEPSARRLAKSLNVPFDARRDTIQRQAQTTQEI